MKTTTLLAWTAALTLVACDATDTPRRTLGTRSAALALEQVTVPAVRRKPVYTGQILHYHEHLVVEAEGTVDLGAGGSGLPPEGASEVCGEGCPNPEGRRGALTAMIAESADETFGCVFEVGASYADRPRCQGRIFLLVNDDDYLDNSGSFTVRFETSPLVRSATCRKECLAAGSADTTTCTEACDDTDPVAYSACVARCEEQAATAFDGCLADRCSGEPEQPADCGQRCSQAASPALQGCLETCPAPTAENPCRHVDCTWVCMRTFQLAAADCLAGTCGANDRPQRCMAECYDAAFDCLDALSPDACEYHANCEDVLSDCGEACAAELGAPAP